MNQLPMLATMLAGLLAVAWSMAVPAQAATYLAPAAKLAVPADMLAPIPLHDDAGIEADEPAGERTAPAMRPLVLHV